MFVLACGDSSGDGDGTDESSDTGSSTDASMTSPTADTVTDTMTATLTAEGSSSGSADTGPDETGSSGPSTGDTGTTTEADTSGTGTDDATSTGEPAADDYPACMEDDDCTDPYTVCWPPMDFGMPNYCTLECESERDCPVPESGTATPVCEGPPGTDVCALDCTEGECPEGMSCVDVFGNGAFMRCSRAE